MKLITLNTWGGRIKEPLLKYIKDNQDVDIFCFQEVNDNPNNDELDDPEKEDKDLFNHIKEVLPNHIGYFSPQAPGVGHAMFIGNQLMIDKVDYDLILAETDIVNMPERFPRIIQTLHFNNKELKVYNFHGVPKDGKRDNPVRDLQTERVMKVISKSMGPKIVAGDFNLNMNTKAISEFEKKFINLIKNSNFQTTRSKLYDSIAEMPFADYIFASPEIVITNFKVVDVEISDHLPILIEFVN